MKLKSYIKRLSSGKTACAILSPLLLSQAALGVITVHFVEEGSDVRVSFSGTIDLTDSPGMATTRSFITSASSVGETDIGETLVVGGGGYTNALGTPSITSLNFLASVSGRTVNDEVFGFGGVSLFWDTRHISGGAVGAVTELTADARLDTFLLPNQSLDTLNAEPTDIAEGATLWTTNGITGDTFVFSRLAPVPEPSSILLVGVGFLGLMRRKR